MGASQKPKNKRSTAGQIEGALAASVAPRATRRRPEIKERLANPPAKKAPRKAAAKKTAKVERDENGDSVPTAKAPKPTKAKAPAPKKTKLKVAAVCPLCKLRTAEWPFCGQTGAAHNGEASAATPAIHRPDLKDEDDDEAPLVVKDEVAAKQEADEDIGAATPSA